jgi:hypothetical protein
MKFCPHPLEVPFLHDIAGKCIDIDAPVAKYLNSMVVDEAKDDST